MPFNAIWALSTWDWALVIEALSAARTLGVATASLAALPARVDFRDASAEATCCWALAMAWASLSAAACWLFSALVTAFWAWSSWAWVAPGCDWRSASACLA